jgi:hypothetical protein
MFGLFFAWEKLYFMNFVECDMVDGCLDFLIPAFSLFWFGTWPIFNSYLNLYFKLVFFNRISKF